MKTSRRILFVTYPGASLMDYSGPAGVFAVANELGDGGDYYEVIIASTMGGLVSHHNGIRVDSRSLASIHFKTTDTLLLTGAPIHALQQASDSADLLRHMQRAAKQCQRIGSICTGTTILGTAGLLEQRRVSTHWAAQGALQQQFPNTHVDLNALYTVDGSLWTSAGVTTGIDMALAMVAEDHGRQLTSKIAKHILVYAHRPGHQKQFSDILLAQTRTNEQFSGLLDWLTDNLDKPIKVEQMAEKMFMSQRSFHRHFCKALHQTPAKFLEELRVDRAKSLLAAGQTVEVTARNVGFASVAAFRKAFKQRVGLTPKHYVTMEHHPS